MSHKILLALGFAALVLAALAGVERLATPHPGLDTAQHAVSSAEPGLPSGLETGNVDPSASPALTR